VRVAMLNITAGGLSQGYEKYLQHIIPRLASHPKVSALLVGIPETKDVSAWLEKYPFLKCIPLKTPVFPWQDIGKWARREVTFFNPDVIFIPTGRFWRINRVPVVNMVRNMEPLTYSNQNNPFIERIRNWLRAILTRNAVKNGDRIIAVSEYVKNSLEEHWNVPRRKLSLIYHGTNQTEDTNSIRPIAVSEDFHNKFVFTAGSIRPARGLEDLILAVKHLPIEDREKIGKVIIAGRIDSSMSKYHQKLEEKITNNKVNSQILFCGDLNEREMTWCYQNCFAFIMTSRVEACPNIALEAMAQGCVCVAADNPPLPEIFRDAAVFYPPKRSEILAQKIHEMLRWPEELRQGIRKRARTRAVQFNWDRCTEETISELTKTINAWEVSD
jgi:glycosyltransferase involved in cell wall biosynthesis